MTKRTLESSWTLLEKTNTAPQSAITVVHVAASDGLQSFHTSTKSSQNSGRGLAGPSLPPLPASGCRLSSLPLFQSFPPIPWSQVTCNLVFALILFKITLLKAKIDITNGRPTIFLSWFLYSPEWLSSFSYTKFIFFHRTLNAGSLRGLSLAPCCLSFVACVPMTQRHNLPQASHLKSHTYEYCTIWHYPNDPWVQTLSMLKIQHCHLS